MRNKLGLETSQAEDQHLLSELLNLMDNDKVDYTILFRRLCEFDTMAAKDNHSIRDLFLQRKKFDLWATKYQQRLEQEKDTNAQRASKMKKVNPKYILRNYMAEVAIKKAEQGDYSEIECLFNVLQKPFDEQTENEAYANFPPEWAQEISVSCSS